MPEDHITQIAKEVDALSYNHHLKDTNPKTTALFVNSSHGGTEARREE